MPDWEEKLAELQEKIGYTFKDIDVLKRALTTVPYTIENGLRKDQHQEAFSTLGDAVQDVIVMNQAIIHGYTKKGYITDAKAVFAVDSSQDIIAKGIKLAYYMRWGRGEKIEGKWKTEPKILARCFEALLGALFTDGGMTTVTESFWVMYGFSHSNLEMYKGNFNHSMHNYYNYLFSLEDDSFLDY